MNFNEFYSSLNDKQRKYYNKEMKDKMFERDARASSSAALNWFLIFLLICSINNGGSLNIFKKK